VRASGGNPQVATSALSMLHLGDVPEPELPASNWVRVQPALSGICGSDLSAIGGHASLYLDPLTSYPFIPGHEVVGKLEDGGRVVIEPALGCVVRGIDPPCPRCAEGRPGLCYNATEGPIEVGLQTGYCASTGGGWGEVLVAHPSQVHAVPDALTDEAAVLIEPFACSVHAVRANMPEPGERVLVIGAGSIGLLTIAALHALAPGARVTALARYDVQRAHAARLGAADVVPARGEYTKALADAGGARLLKPIIGKPVGVGGFDRTFVCIGGARGMDDAMRVTRAGGTIVLLGNSSTMNGLDWTPLWLKELTLRGSLCYGGPVHGGASEGAFAEAASLIASGAAPIAELLTHTFALGDYRKALETASNKAGGESIKVAFRF